MALIAMTVWNTESTQHAELTDQTLDSISKTVDWDRHRMFICDNGSYKKTFDVYDKYKNIFPFTLIENGSNIGTARAINKAWLHRKPLEHCLKCDADWTCNTVGWLDILEEILNRDPSIGIVGLKRKDCAEWMVNSDGTPVHGKDWNHSKLRVFPHKPGERWIAIEEVLHCIGTSQLYHWYLLDKIGYLKQIGCYAFDDCLAAARCQIAGMKCAFFPWIEIDHNDPGGTPYQSWKEKFAGEVMPMYDKLVADYRSGTRPIYEGPD